ncbi:MAG: transglutaminase domain-containing protein [Treponema sp.]
MTCIFLRKGITMQNCSKPPAALRFISLFLLLSVPHRYLGELLPAAVLSLWGAACAYGICLLHKRGLRGTAAFILGFAAALLLPAAVLGFLALIPQLAADTLYLRIRLITALLVITAFASMLSTAGFLYSKRWHRYEPLAALALFALLFIPQHGYRLTVFSNPIFAAGFAGGFTVLQIILLCIPAVQKHRIPVFLLVFLPLTAAVLIFLTQFFNKAAVGNNGGLLEQKLFDFDFSQFLQLQDEVKMNTQLVMVVHIEQDYASHLFRRMYLSGWHPQKGFYEKTAPGEAAQLLQLPKQHQDLPHQPFQCREKVRQEIFTVNLDPASVIALDYPVSITPYTVWDSLSFKGAYQAESEILHGVPLDLITAEAPSGNPAEGLTQAALDFYTELDNRTEQLLRPIAEALTGDLSLYYDKVYTLLDYFREGEYRYSLHPGQAPDGDQLRYFITDVKKGYCSYFAFSYCLMLRSIGIPARVAAGFFLQPESGVLNYYPVRSNMAHAWVEVFFPYLGWISLDPTTEQLADGEALDVSFQAGGDGFTALLDEILLNRAELKPRLGGSITDEQPSFPQQIRRFLQTHPKGLAGVAAALILILGMMAAAFPHLIIRFSKNKRRIILTLKKIHKQPSAEFLVLTQKAKFAPSCSDEDVQTAKELYRSERKRFRFRFLLPTLFFMLPVMLFPDSGAELLLQQADKAIQAENWDTAAALLKEGISRYPGNELFHLKAGDMYLNNALHDLAYRHFTQGLQINTYNIKLLYGAASAAAALNREEEARRFLHEYLSYNPADVFAWSSYGWLCFKTHNIEEGIQSMLQARSNYGDDGSIANALGNLYGELFDYENADSYYRKGIALALEKESYYSASVYSYNKAILQAVFYHFDAAETDARNAVEYFSRASGYLMLGELEERKNNFDRAIAYYIQSTENNHTPLPLINLAKMYLRMGRLEEAERYVRQIERITDRSWIANFGMSTVQFYAEQYSLYKTLYEKKYAAEKMRIPESLTDFFVRQKNLLGLAAAVRYYRALFSIYHVKLAEEYTLPDSYGTPHELYMNSFYYRAFESVPFKARRYLQRAEELETQFIPQAQASYIAEKGILLRDVRLLQEALRRLDPVWEKELREQTTAALITTVRNAETQAALCIELMRSNPACFPEHWIRLPIRLVCTGAEPAIQAKTKKRLTAALSKSLYRLSKTADKPPFVLTADCASESLTLTLTGADGSTYFRYTHPSPVLTKREAAACINRFTAQLFRVRE